MSPKQAFDMTHLHLLKSRILLTSDSVSHAEYLLEGLPELRVEDGVDERVDAAVEVAQPRGQVEGDVAGHPTE